MFDFSWLLELELIGMAVGLAACVLLVVGLFVSVPLWWLAPASSFAYAGVRLWLK